MKRDLRATCATCPYYHPQKERYGFCIRHAATVLKSPESCCGDHPDFFLEEAKDTDALSLLTSWTNNQTGWHSANEPPNTNKTVIVSDGENYDLCSFNSTYWGNTMHVRCIKYWHDLPSLNTGPEKWLPYDPEKKPHGLMLLAFSAGCEGTNFHGFKIKVGFGEDTYISPPVKYLRIIIDGLFD